MGAEQDTKKQSKFGLIISCCLVLILIMSVFGITYALFSYNKQGQVRNTITSGSITFTYVETSNGISLENAMPISDRVGKSLEQDKNNNGYFDFNVSCNIAGTSSVNYEVYAIKQKVDHPLKDEYVKVYLTDGTTDQPISGYSAEVPTYENLKQSISNKDAKQLYYGTFNNNGTQKFRLRMWVSDQYAISSTSEQFKIKVNVEAKDR